MKPISRFLVLVTVVTLALVLWVMPAAARGAPAQGPAPEATAVDFLVQLLFGVAVTVPGFTALGVVIVNLLKIPGWIKDDQAPIFLNIFNVVSAVVIGVLILFLPNVDVPGLDVKFGQLANTLTILLPTFVLLYKWLAPYFHRAIRGVPAIGYSYTLATLANKAKAKTK